MISVLLRTGDFLNFIKLSFVDLPSIFALAQGLANKFICQNQFGFRQPVKVQTDGDGLALVFDLDQNLVAFCPRQNALKAFAAVDQLGRFDLGDMLSA